MTNCSSEYRQIKERHDSRDKNNKKQKVIPFLKQVDFFFLAATNAAVQPLNHAPVVIANSALLSYTVKAACAGPNDMYQQKRNSGLQKIPVQQFDFRLSAVCMSE